MAESNFSAIRNILDVFDRVSEILNNKNGESSISLPRIVIMGIQSSGKSSILESISGIDLPRDDNICTRCPIQIRLRKAKAEEFCRIKYGDQSNSEWKEINSDEINETIREYQDELFIGANGNANNNISLLSDRTIVLEINKVHVPDLTLVDLPGVTYKNESTELTIKNIIIKYIKDPNTIVLYAHNAAVDFDANECIKLIKQVDKEYKESNIFDRIIPIITKIDTVKSNQLIQNMIMSKQYHFNYSPIMVRNRTNEELKKKTSSDDVRQQEEELIKNLTSDPSNELFKYNESTQGIKGLVNLLVKIQSRYLINSKSKVKDEVRGKLKFYKREYKKFPKACNSREDFIEELDNFTNDLEEKLKFKMESGNYSLMETDDENSIIKENEYCLETFLGQSFEEIRKDFNKKFYHYFTIKTYKKVEKMVMNSRKLKFSNFYGEECIYKILKQDLKKYFDFIIEIIEKFKYLIFNEITKPYNEALEKYNGNYDRFVTESKLILTRLLDKNSQECIQYFEEKRNIEERILYTSNPFYLDISEKIQQAIKRNLSNLNPDILKNSNNNNSDFDDDDTLTYNINVNNNIDNYSFYDYTGLNKNIFDRFIKELSNLNKVDDYNIRIICSVYSYLKLYMDNFLDNVYKGIIFYFLHPFQEKRFSIYLSKEFQKKSDDELNEIMVRNEETRIKMEELKEKIKRLIEANNELETI